MRFNFSKNPKDYLPEWNALGFIPGPGETSDAFRARVKALETFFESPHIDVDHYITDTEWKAPLEKVQSMYDISPDWIVAHYSDKNLPFFQPAATWICKNKGVKLPLIQLKKKLERRGYLGICSKDEVLAHEAVHAARMEFNEPFFEEIFAYKTSSRAYRRFFGPLFIRSWETYCFLALLLLPIALQFAYSLFIDVGPWDLLAYLPLAFFALALLRTTFLQYTLSRAMKRISPFLKQPKRPLPVLVRLTDRQIFHWAFSSPDVCEETWNATADLRTDFIEKIYIK